MTTGDITERIGLTSPLLQSLQRDGACRQISKECWFSDKPGPGKQAAIARRAICQSCPVLLDCDDWTQQSREEGWWAGRQWQTGRATGQRPLFLQRALADRDRAA